MALAAFVAWLIHSAALSRALDWKLAAYSLEQVRFQWLLAAALAIYGTYIVRALRWAVFLRPLKPKSSLLNLVSCTVMGFTAITLLGRPGELVRPYLIARKEKVPFASQLAALIVERIFDLLMALAIFGLALTRLDPSTLRVAPHFTPTLSMGGRIVVVACGSLLLFLVFLRHFAQPVSRRLVRVFKLLPEGWFRRLEGLISTFIQGVESTRSDAALLLALFYSIVQWVLIWTCYVSQAAAFTAFQLTGVEVLIFMGFVNFGVVIQIPGIGGGMQAVAILVLTELFGIRLELATAFAFLIWAMMFVAVVPAGLLIGIKQGVNYRKLRQIRAEQIACANTPAGAG